MILALLLGCASHLATTPPPAGPPPVPGPAAPHGAAVLQARDAVVTPDLPAFQRAITTLGRDFPLAGQPAEAQAELVAALARAAAAKGEGEAAMALGNVAVACGSCHTATGATLATAETPSAPTGDGVRSEMARHDRALDLLWRGLVTPSEDTLRAGLSAYRASTLVPISGMPSEAALVLDEAINATAEKIVESPDPATRAALFGALLNTCASCHRAPPPGLIEPY